MDLEKECQLQLDGLSLQVEEKKGEKHFLLKADFAVTLEGTQ
jgi:hypothetical protein